MDDEEEHTCGCHHHHQEGQEEEQKQSHHDNCCCNRHSHHGLHHSYGFERHGCRCGRHEHHQDFGLHRRFISKEEIIASLENYLKDLKAEAQGVEEHIEELKKENKSEQK
jgi:hypothetical protein